MAYRPSVPDNVNHLQVFEVVFLSYTRVPIAGSGRSSIALDVASQNQDSTCPH
jgi:hypothetical protein